MLVQEASPLAASPGVDRDGGFLMFSWRSAGFEGNNHGKTNELVLFLGGVDLKNEGYPPQGHGYSKMFQTFDFS